MTPKLPRPTAEASTPPSPKRSPRVLALLGAPLVVGYPVLVYYFMQHYSARVVAMVLLLGLSPFLVRGFVARRNALGHTAVTSEAVDEGPWYRSWRRRIWPLLALALLALSMLVNSVRSLLLVPLCINGALLLTFGPTLFEERPLIERFARLQDPDLTPPEQRWCRTWTAIWTGFFAINMLLAGAFALRRSMEWWTLYNGLISYVVMGLLFATEYVVRKWRFQRFANHAWDRALCWCFVRLGQKR